MSRSIFAPNGPGFKGLYAGDVVSFIEWRGTSHGAQESFERTAAVLPLLVFADHVQVRYGPCGYTVDDRNFVRLVRRGKRHTAAVRAVCNGHIPNARGSICMRCGNEV